MTTCRGALLADPRHLITVEHGVLNYAHDKSDPNADATLTLSKATLNAVQLKEATLDERIASGDIRIGGPRRIHGPSRYLPVLV